MELQLQCQAAVALRQALAARVQRPGPIAVIIAGLLSRSAWFLSTRIASLRMAYQPQWLQRHDVQHTCKRLLRQ